MQTLEGDQPLCAVFYRALSDPRAKGSRNPWMSWSKQARSSAVDLSVCRYQFCMGKRAKEAVWYVSKFQTHPLQGLRLKLEAKGHSAEEAQGACDTLVNKVKCWRKEWGRVGVFSLTLQPLCSVAFGCTHPSMQVSILVLV